ncbi:hypothetical protein QQF64_030076 [Cirrhinus molitorella]|uniref:Uncharacterized protein n=1 Tax=Cirrhinus molitorella TaxID=172907 RepID=A0ABR3N2N7_9TELE
MPVSDRSGVQLSAHATVTGFVVQRRKVTYGSTNETSRLMWLRTEFLQRESINYVAKALNGGNDRSMGKGNPRVNTTRAALFVETVICGSERFLVSCEAPSERFIVRYAKEEQMNLSTTRGKP